MVPSFAGNTTRWFSDEVIAIATELVNESFDWAEECLRLPALDSIQAVDQRNSRVFGEGTERGHESLSVSARPTKAPLL